MEKQNSAPLIYVDGELVSLASAPHVWYFIGCGHWNDGVGIRVGDYAYCFICRHSTRMRVSKIFLRNMRKPVSSR